MVEVLVGRRRVERSGEMGERKEERKEGRKKEIVLGRKEGMQFRILWIHLLDTCKWGMAMKSSVGMEGMSKD